MPDAFPRRFRTLPVLQTKRLYLRRPLLTDSAELFSYMKNQAVCRYEAWNTHLTEIETLGFINDVLNRIDERKAAEWVIERQEDGRVIGVINLHDYNEANEHAEIGFWFGEEHWGNGYATEAARRVLDFAFRDLKLNRVTALCVVENEASRHVLQKLGMTYEGTMRKYIRIKGTFRDIMIFSLLKDEN